MALAIARLRFANIVQQPCFIVDVRGGVNTFQRIGVYADTLRAGAVSGTGETCCRMFSLRQSFSCTLVNDVYSDESAGKLCEAWASKMQLLLSRWMGSGYVGDFEFQAHDVVWPEPAAFTAFVASASPTVRSRVRQIRSIRPRKASLSHD